MTFLFEPNELILEFYYMRNFYRRYDMTLKLPVLNFKEIGS